MTGDTATHASAACTALLWLLCGVWPDAALPVASVFDQSFNDTVDQYMLDRWPDHCRAERQQLLRDEETLITRWAPLPPNVSGPPPSQWPLAWNRSTLRLPALNYDRVSLLPGRADSTAGIHLEDRSRRFLVSLRFTEIAIYASDPQQQAREQRLTLWSRQKLQRRRDITPPTITAASLVNRGFQHQPAELRCRAVDWAQEWLLILALRAKRHFSRYDRLEIAHRLSEDPPSWLMKYHIADNVVWQWTFPTDPASWQLLELAVHVTDPTLAGQYGYRLQRLATTAADPPPWLRPLSWLLHANDLSPWGLLQQQLIKSGFQVQQSASGWIYVRP